MNYLDNFKVIKNKIVLSKKTSLIVVTKNQTLDKIFPIIKSGHLDFGENKIQEAKEKWKNIISDNKNLRLHFLGKLQSNKVKDAFFLFDFIHTLDNDKLAIKFSQLEKNSNRRINYFVQVNIGNEIQKNGINELILNEFVNFCKNDQNLNIIGLMCIPPINQDPHFFFRKMLQLNEKNNLAELSMGMSNDYLEAIKCGSTFVRIGSAIFK